jgi:hypothetical protein
MDSVKTKKANYILQKTIRLQMEAWTLLYIAEDNKVADGSVDSIVEDNKDGDRSQTKGADYIHSYMKQGLGGS